MDVSITHSVGYVAELLSRLTGDRSYVRKDKTQVNHTSDQETASFPLDRKVYIDFTHDNQLSRIMIYVSAESQV